MERIPAIFRPRDDELLPVELALGTTALTVTDLERSCTFYERALGLRVLTREPGRAEVGVDEPVLELHERHDAGRAGRHAGLYHVALLYPSRVELARVGRRLLDADAELQGASDHGTHEAWYLADPDGNGLELAADRPRREWQPYGRDAASFAPRPLDVDGLLALAAGPEELPTHAAPGVRVGHLHLHVGDIAEAAHFYVDVVGFDEKFRMDTALFVAAGGYHHHLGVNTWKGTGIGPAPDDVVGLRHWTVVLPGDDDAAQLEARVEAAGAEVDRAAGGGFDVRDPWGNRLRVSVQ